jgi:TonB family protein
MRTPFISSAAFALTILGAFTVPAAGAAPFDLPPQVIAAPAPTYPQKLVSHDVFGRGVDGQATVEFTIDAQGAVHNERVIQETRKEFGPAALAAIRLWKFTPAMKAGHPVSVSHVHQTMYFNDTNSDFQLYPADDKGPDRPALVVYSIAPKYPQALWDQKIQGDATVQFTVGTDGRARDATVIEASRKEFGEAALGAIKQWKFTPGTINWKPAGIKYWQRHFSFQQSDFMTDQLPRVLERAPIRPDNLWDKKQRALVQFIVDRKGNVRDATVLETSSKDFGQAALNAIVKWKFKPALKDGQPVNVDKVQQVFEFAPDSSGN